MTDVQSLHCPNCGAAVDPQGPRCPYCRARLATVSCPDCYALMFAGAVFCPHCGARAARTDSKPSSHACPGCRARLVIVQVGDIELLECGSCDGLWIDAADFERICANHEAQAAVLERWRPASTEPGRGAAIHYRPCLHCGKMMNRVNFGRLSGTIVDLCRGHGAFLDAGELHAIVTFIQAGGLDRARQREKDDLEEERRRLGSLMQIESRSIAADWEHQSNIGESLLELRRLLKGE